MVKPIQEVPQAKVKKGIDRDQWFKQKLDFAKDYAVQYWKNSKIVPAELTFSLTYFPYIDECGQHMEAYKMDEKGIIQATGSYGNLYIQIPKDMYEGLWELDDDKEYEEAQKMFQLGNPISLYLIEAHKLLKLAVPDADLFLWAEGLSNFRITDLNQEPDFKRELKKKGLI